MRCPTCGDDGRLRELAVRLTQALGELYDATGRRRVIIEAWLNGEKPPPWLLAARDALEAALEQLGVSPEYAAQCEAEAADEARREMGIR